MGRAEREWAEEALVQARAIAEKAYAALAAGEWKEVDNIFGEETIAQLRGMWHVIEDGWIKIGELSRNEQRLIKRLRKLLHVLDETIIYYKLGDFDEAFHVLAKHLER